MLYLARHGRTVANASGLLLGRADPPLDDVGRAQASALASAVPPGARVVASSLRRARETAAAIGGSVEIDDRWIELDYGGWDQKPVAAVSAEEWAEWRADIEWAPPGGESLAALGRRVRAACEELADAARDGDVVVVSHVSPLKAAIAWVLDVGDEVAWRLHLSTGSLSRAAVRDHGAVLLSFDDVAHLS